MTGKHVCDKAKEYGAEYFHSTFFKGWVEKYPHNGVIFSAFYCKYCGKKLEEAKHE